MKFVFPIEGKKASDLYAINRDGVGGYYPIGLNNTYHGGLHIDGNHAVVAIADGTVVAYRYNKTCLDETLENKKYAYSNSFVLIRHEYTTPKGQKLTFYSHYCHLCPWDEFSEEQKKRTPVVFTKPGFKIKLKSDKSTLNVHSSMDSSEKANNTLKGKELKNGNEVIATAVDDEWAKKDGVDEYFVFKGFSEPISIASTPSFDAIVTCENPVKAGSLVGYSGKFETDGAPDKYTTVHVEVFAGNDIEEFITNPKKDGDKKPTQLLIAAGTQLKVKEPKYDPALIKSKHLIIAGTTMKIINNSNQEYVQVRETKLQATISNATKESCLHFEGHSNYTIKWENVRELSDAFNGFEFEKTDKILFEHYIDEKGHIVKSDKAPNRMISFDVPEKRAEQCWVKRAALKYNKDGSALAETAVNETYTANPALAKFEKTAGAVAEETFFSLKEAKTASDENNTVWYNVKVGSLDGWIAENDPNITKLSAFDWPGFKIAKEEGDTAYDPVIDFKNLTPFFKNIVDEINVDKDKSTISSEEMQSALKNDKLASKLSHLICFHQSEWWVDKEMAYWEPVFKKLGNGKTAESKVENLKTRIKNLCWWDDVASNVKGFPAAPNVYHFHPVAFVENMQDMVNELEILLEKQRLTSKEIALARKYIAELDKLERAVYYTKLQEKVNYRNQRNNAQTADLADRMCNLTSLAMALEYLGVENPEPDLQFEDYLEKIRVEKKYTARTDDDSWGKLAENFGIEMKNIDLNTSDKNILTTKLKPEIEAGNGVVISAFSVASGKGHIVRLQQVVDDGLIVDDPFGKVNNFKQRESGGSGYTGTANKRDSESGLGEDNLWKWDDISETVIKYADAFYYKE
jgi:hypothetical protein